MNFATDDQDGLLNHALGAARDTRFLVVNSGARADAARIFTSAFGNSAAAIIVADDRTFAVIGDGIQEIFRGAGIAQADPVVFKADVYAEMSFVESLQQSLTLTNAIPVAVGSGTLNDLTKLAAHRAGRPYMSVATAASMDGYTAYGASITFRGSKQTFDCPAPRAVLADLDIIGRAPVEMNASGYADLLAKGVAGADWILADAAGEESIDPGPWSTVQDLLPSWVGSPAGIVQADADCLRHLVIGLMMSGFAMQAAKTSRPASGAEHQFSHLWDMQHHVYQGAAPSHGFKVGIGTLASLDLYDVLLRRDLDHLNVDAALAAWLPLKQVEERIGLLFGTGELAEKAIEETRAKYPTLATLRAQLERLREGWPTLRARLSQHLKPYHNARAMLREAGAPFEAGQIGIFKDRLRLSYEQAYYIRRRYTVLDFAVRAGVFHSALKQIFEPDHSALERGVEFVRQN